MPINGIEAHSSRASIASSREWLTRAHLGSYGALLAAGERNSIEVVRAPLGDLACYVLPTESGLFLASDVDLLVAFAGYAPVIDWPVLAQHLAAPDLPRRRTCLEGLDELGEIGRASCRERVCQYV